MDYINNENVRNYEVIIEDSDKELANENGLIEVPDRFFTTFKDEEVKNDTLTEKKSIEQNISTEGESENSEQNTEDAQDQESENIEDQKEEKEEKNKKSYRHTERNRIHNLTKQLKEAQSAAYLERKAKLETEHALKLASYEALEHYEKRLELEKQSILKALQEAEEQGDIEAKTKNYDLLNSFNNTLFDVAKNKKHAQQLLSENYVDNKQQKYVENVSEYEAPSTNYADPKVKRNSQNWLRSNSWADPNDRNFDQEMYQEADNYSGELIRTYKLDGRADEIGSEEFFKDITSHVNSVFRISTPQKQSPNTLQMKKPSVVTSSPVNRSVSLNNINSTPRNYKDVQLTAEEIRNAKGLVNAQIAKTHADAIDIWKQHKFKEIKRGNNI